MIDREELNIHIARLEYEESSYSNYAKLADLYAIRDHLPGYGAEVKKEQPENPYAFASAGIKVRPTTEFLSAVEGKNAGDVLKIMDELMDLLRVVNAKVYDSMMDKLRRL